MLYERLLKQLKQHKEELEALILKGRLEDYASYRHITGKLSGLNDAIEILRETFKRNDNDDER